MIRFAWIFFSLIAYMAEAQPRAGFTFPVEPYTVCRNESLVISNGSTESESFLWDFCPETFHESPTQATLQTSTDFSRAASYKIIKDGSKWFGFLVNRSANKILRLDFGEDPGGIPTVVDLGNPDGLLVSPEGIDIYYHGGAWHGFVGYNGDVVRLAFGEMLSNDSPAATRLNLSGAKRFPDLKIVEQAGRLVVLALVLQDNAIRRLDFGTSFSNAPAVTEMTVSTVEFPLGISVVKAGDNWIAHLTSFIQNGTSKFSITQLNFGTDIFNAPINEARYNFPGLERPHRIRMHFSGGEYFGFVSNEFKNISVINFHDLDPENTPVAIPDTALPLAIGFDIVKHEGKSVMHAIDYAANSLKKYSYEKVCDQNVSWSTDREPADLKFNAAGFYAIDLLAFSDGFTRSEASHVLTVGTGISSEISILNDFVCVNTEINFSVNTADENIVSWSWDFGNGETSVMETTSVIYASPDTYPVTLIVEADNGCRARSMLNLEIFPAPVATFSMPSGLICTNNDLTFSPLADDIFAGNLSYQWYVDGILESSERNLVHAFQTIGAKEIKLITSLPGCSDEVTRTTSTVEAGPAVDFSHTGECAGETFQFIEEVSEAVESYRWDFGDGQTSSQPDPEAVFETPGDFSVSLTATNDTGCENVKTKIIAAEARPVVAFHVPGPPNACSGSSVVFLNQTTHPADIGDTEWLWEFGDAHNHTVATDMDPRHVFTEPGVYQVSLTAKTPAGCEANLQKPVIIERSPSAHFTFTPACDDAPAKFSAPLDDVANWYWEVESVYYQTASPTHTFRAPGDYPVYLEITGSNNCSSELTRTIHVPVPLSPQFSVLKNCVNEEAIFTDVTSGTDAVLLQEWNFSSGQFASGSPVVHSFTEEGNTAVSLKVTTASGCSYEVHKMVQVLPSPVAAFSAHPPTGAFPLEVHFVNSSTAATTYLWHFSDGSGATSNEDSPAYTFLGPGTYDVALVASNEQQCQDSAKTLIATVAPLPDVDIEMITATANPDGSWKLIITLHNKGNTILKNTPVDIDFEGNLSLRQTATEPILPGSKYNLIFNTGLLEIHDMSYVCASVKVEDDRFPKGNRICREFNDSFVVFSGYPNPTIGMLNLEWIAPATSSFRLTVTDALGRTVIAGDLASSKGFNHVDIDLKNLQNGIYYLRIDNGIYKNTQRILVNSQP